MGVRRFPNASYGPLELRPLLRAWRDEDECPIAWGQIEEDTGLVGLAAGLLMFWVPFAPLLAIGSGRSAILLFTTKRVIILGEDRRAIDPESAPVFEAEIGAFSIIRSAETSYEIRIGDQHEETAFQFEIDRSINERLSNLLDSLAEVEQSIEPDLGRNTPP